MLEGVPGLTRCQPGGATQPSGPPLLTVLGFQLQHLQQRFQGLAMSRLLEPGHRLGAHRGQLEGRAELAYPIGVGVRIHQPTP